MQSVHLFYMWVIRAYEKDTNYVNFRQGSSEDVFEYDPSVSRQERMNKIREEMKTIVYDNFKDELLHSFDKLGKKVAHFEIYIHGVREADAWSDIRGSFVIPS